MDEHKLMTLLRIAFLFLSVALPVSVFTSIKPL